MEWRRIIRSADRREKGEEEINALAKTLAREYRVGDPNPPAHIQCLYHEMSWYVYFHPCRPYTLIVHRVFRNYPKYWDSSVNKWKSRWFRYDESEGEVCSDLQLVYEAVDRMDEESDDADTDSQF
jgi:hypothetical protein